VQRIRNAVLLAALALLGACQDQPTTSTPDGSPTLARAAGVEGYPTPGEPGTGYILGRDGKLLRVDYEVHEGRAIWQGDIDLGPAASVARTPELLRRPESGRQGVVIDALARRWPGGVVPYVIDGSVGNQWRVTDAIAMIEAATDIVDFVPRTTQGDYVRVVNASGCSSAIGRQGSVQNLNLASNCTTGNAAHEFLHALGMHHEQSRCDRDSFVQIVWNNIQSDAVSNFTAQCDGYTDLFEYNEGSIMHYPADGFGIGGATTIVSLRGLGGLMGQRNGLAGTDVATVDWMYPRPYNAFISGKQYVAKHESAPYTATVTGGTGPFTYEWRTRQSGPSTSGTWSGWFSTGSSNVTYASINSCGLNTNYLEVRVTDSTGRQTTGSYTMYITNPC
jgi:hypothetical protein